MILKYKLEKTVTYKKTVTVNVDKISRKQLEDQLKKDGWKFTVTKQEWKKEK